ncbi:MAG: tRNA dihydrouridine synthase DusB [Clostridia bacterium]|jgi:tRNA-dihydrouridine synthase B|nr:tRNA dihydrouridine synthase DusB [Clostridia bacterium]NLS84715.1 tRNA dihydrouridine synthase DusB [Oscillospiraceae bacterium]
MKLGDIEIKLGAALAPMAGVTDLTMRILCAQYGAVYTVSEMVSAKALVMGDKKSQKLMAGGGGNAPYGIQLFGGEPTAMGGAANSITSGEYRGVTCDFLDINYGCPAPKITGNGAGSALLKDLPLLSETAEAVVKNSNGTPVTAKMRIGWDEEIMTGVEAAKRLEAAGIQMLTVHGRTRKEMYIPGIHADEIAKIKAAVSIPVLANGDVTSAQTALNLLKETGCDGVAIGRAAMGNSWLFAEISAALNGEPAPEPPTLKQRFATMRKQIYDMCEDKGERIAMQQARSYATWYMHGLRGAAALRRECCSLTYFTDVDKLISAAWRVQEMQNKEERR